MPTEPSARDREEARRIAGRCWYATSDSPDATCDAVGAPDRCVQCVETDAIATALAAREAEVREADCRAVCKHCAGGDRRIDATPVPTDRGWAHERIGGFGGGTFFPCHAAAIRAGGGA